MAHRHAVRSAQAAEVVALHGAGEALADGRAGHVHELALDEMVGGDLGADLDHILRAHAELDELALGLDIGHGEMAARGAAEPLHLGRAGAELKRGVAVLLGRAMADDLATLEAQHRHRDMLPGVGEDPRHAELLRDDT